MTISAAQLEYLASKDITPIPIGTTVRFKPDSHYAKQQPKRFAEQLGVVFCYRMGSTEPTILFEPYGRWKTRISFNEVNPKYFDIVEKDHATENQD